MVTGIKIFSRCSPLLDYASSVINKYYIKGKNEHKLQYCFLGCYNKAY